MRWSIAVTTGTRGGPGQHVGQRHQDAEARVSSGASAPRRTSPARRPKRVRKPRGRCVVTTTDQITGEVGSQPLKMLGRRRRFGQQLVFGQNMLPAHQA